MDNKSATKAEASPSVIKDTTPTDNLEKDKKDMTTEMKISDAMEMLEGFESMSVDGSSSDEEPYSRFGTPVFGPGGGRGLFVGGRFSGGRCGGQGFCRRSC
ncbi:F27J15.8 [Arabidopsis thaliana]|uniref:F27J15.8 n=1 Tax=Arabidopsis thaliana TaxID=3702 RepID=Q9M9B5_ARATH|nr:F27J15.8 [Arabidopsis thaliana]